MTYAVAEWEQEQKRPEKERTSLYFFAEQRNTPYTTLQMHITSNDAKRTKLGSSAGREPIIGGASAEIIADVQTKFTRKQLDQYFRRAVRPLYSERLTNFVAVQNTTTKRAATTVPQQFRWHKANMFL